LDLDPTQTAHVLRDMGVGARPPASRQRERADVARDELVDLYVRQHLSTEAVGEALGVSNNTVLDRLRSYGIPVQPRGGGRRPLVAKDVLEDLYIRQGLSLEEVAHRLDMPVERVAASRRAHGLPVQGRRRPPLPRAQLEELYVHQGLSVEEVAARTHASRGRVTRDMDSYGMARRRRGRKPAGPN
jgi:transposase